MSFRFLKKFLKKDDPSSDVSFHFIIAIELVVTTTARAAGTVDFFTIPRMERCGCMYICVSRHVTRPPTPPRSGAFLLSSWERCNQSLNVARYTQSTHIPVCVREEGSEGLVEVEGERVPRVVVRRLDDNYRYRYSFLEQLKVRRYYSVLNIRPVIGGTI